MPNIKNISDFYREAHDLVSVFNIFIEQNNLATDVRADHICYRCESKEVFEALREIFETESDFIYQSIISGRRIAIIKFKKGIETEAGVLQYLELSDQKPDNSQTNTFDHIEIYPIALSYKKLITRLESSGVSLVRVERPHHTTYDTKLGDHYSVKITEQPLIEKIKAEEMA